MLLQKGPLYFAKPRGRSTNPARWSRVPQRVSMPTRGVAVREGGHFHAALRENVEYFLRFVSADHTLYPFRARAGQPDAPGKESQVKFWDARLEGRNPGRFLIGAGNTLRWMEHGELCWPMDAVVDGIEACRAPDGYLHGLSREHMIADDPGTRWGEPQRSNCAHAWVRHGLVDVSLAGNPKACRSSLPATTGSAAVPTFPDCRRISSGRKATLRARACTSRRWADRRTSSCPSTTTWWTHGWTSWRRASCGRKDRHP